MAPRVVSKTQHFDFNRDPIYEDERFKLLMIQDSTDCKGFGIFKTVINLYCKADIYTTLISLDGPAEDIISGIDFKKDKLLVFDEFANTSAWSKQTFREKFMEKLTNLEGLLCIYSLTSLLIQESAIKVYQLLHEILSINSKLHVIAMLHVDVHSPFETQIFNSLSTSVIDISSTLSEDKFLLTMSTKNKAYGQLTYEYSLSSSNFLFEYVRVAPKFTQAPIKKLDPTANLTFNLNLNKKEKVARDHLELPFTKALLGENIVSQDLEDFYEEEDPDDDLMYLESV